MSRPVSHLFEVTIEVELPEGQMPSSSGDFQMPKWSPGRYACLISRKNVQQFEALGWYLSAGRAMQDALVSGHCVYDQT